MPPDASGLCPSHGLRAAPDGLCVLCRRSVPAPQSTAGIWLGVGLGVAALVLGAALVLRGRAPQVVQLQADTPSSTSTEEPAAAYDDRRDAADRRVALEQAEQERRRAVAAGEPGPRPGGNAADPAPRAGADASAGPEPDVRGLLSQVSVTLYTTNWCGYCRKTRDLLRQNGIAYQELDIEQDEAARQRARQLNPRGGVPVLQIDDQVVLGYSPQGISRGLSTALSRRSGRPIQVELTN